MLFDTVLCARTARHPYPYVLVRVRIVDNLHVRVRIVDSLHVRVCVCVRACARVCVCGARVCMYVCAHEFARVALLFLHARARLPVSFVKRCQALLTCLPADGDVLSSRGCLRRSIVPRLFFAALLASLTSIPRIFHSR